MYDPMAQAAVIPDITPGAPPGQFAPGIKLFVKGMGVP